MLPQSSAKTTDSKVSVLRISQRVTPSLKQKSQHQKVQHKPLMVRPVHSGSPGCLSETQIATTERSVLETDRKVSVLRLSQGVTP